MAESTAVTTELVPGPRGGKLWTKGPPPDRRVAGPGRPPSELRKRLREDYAGTLHLLREFAEGKGEEPPSVSDRIRAMEQMAKYGLGDAKLDTELVEQLAAAMVEVVPAEVLEPYRAELHARWTAIIAERAG